MKINKVEHLSASSIKADKQCPFKFFLNYVMKIRMPGNYAADMGSFIHEIFEFIANGTLTMDTWEQWAKDNVHKLYDMAMSNKGLTPDEVWDDVVRLTNLVFNREDKFNPLKWKIIDAEKEFKLTMESGCVIKGFIDLVIEDDKDTLLIVDWKSGKFALSQKEAARDPQVLMYRIAAEILYPGYKYYNVCLDYLQKRPVFVASSDKMIAGAKKALGRYWRRLTNITEVPQRKEKPDFKCQYLCDRPTCDKYWEMHERGELIDDE